MRYLRRVSKRPFRVYCYMPVFFNLLPPSVEHIYSKRKTCLMKFPGKIFRKRGTEAEKSYISLHRAGIKAGSNQKRAYVSA